MAETVGEASYVLDRRRRLAPILPSVRNSRSKGIVPVLAGSIPRRGWIAVLKEGGAGRLRGESQSFGPLEAKAGLDPRATLRLELGDPVDTGTICDLGPSGPCRSERSRKRMLLPEAPRREASRPSLRHTVAGIWQKWVPFCAHAVRR